jgi:hypothetical protein
MRKAEWPEKSFGYRNNCCKNRGDFVARRATQDSKGLVFADVTGCLKGLLCSESSRLGGLKCEYFHHCERLITKTVMTEPAGENPCNSGSNRSYRRPCFRGISQRARNMLAVSIPYTTFCASNRDTLNFVGCFHPIDSQKI